MNYPASFEDRFGEWPIDRFLSFAVYTSNTLIDTPADTCRALELTLEWLPEGIQSFDRASYFPYPTGNQRRFRYSSDVLAQIKAALQDKRLRSICLFSAENRGTDWRRPQLTCWLDGSINDGINSLGLITPFLGGDTSALFHPFAALCGTIDACYGLAGVYAYSPDSEAERGYYASIIDDLPLQTLNANGFRRETKTKIKDICWLNFLSWNHLGQVADLEIELAHLSVKTSELETGKCFQIATDPFLEDLDMAAYRRVRTLAQPLRAPDDWYRYR
jgi:hypothetical protein